MPESKPRVKDVLIDHAPEIILTLALTSSAFIIYRAFKGSPVNIGTVLISPEALDLADKGRKFAAAPIAA